MKLSDFKIDPNKLENGGWVAKIPDMGALRLKVRGIGNVDFRKLQSRLIEAEPRKYKVGGRLNPERQDAITAQCLLHTVLLDWDGLRDENGAPIPYSLEQARELLTNPEYRHIRDAIAWAASVVADGKEADLEDDGKNLDQPSSGN